MHTLSRSVAAVAALAVTAAAAQAQPKAANFSGDWTLNTAKSDFGGLPAPPALTASVVQSAGLFKFTQSVAGQSITQDIPLAAKDSTWNAPDGQPITSSAKWAGDTLVVNFKAERQGQTVTQINRWSMSPDGKTLTMGQQMATLMGAMNVTLVFDKKN